MRDWPGPHPAVAFCGLLLGLLCLVLGMTTDPAKLLGRNQKRIARLTERAGSPQAEAARIMRDYRATVRGDADRPIYSARLR